MNKEQVVSKVAECVVWWIDSRRKKLKKLSHSSMAVNPFLLPLQVSLGGIKSFNDLAHLLLAGHFSIGHATGFGKLIDEKILPLAFDAKKLNKAFRKSSSWTHAMFDEIDHVVHRREGRTYLLCQKAGRWTIQLTMAVKLNSAFVELLEARRDGKIRFDGIVVGAFYGTTVGLSDKYDILRGVNRGASHNVVDIQADVKVYAGRTFWSWLNDDEDQTQDWVMEGILRGIRLSEEKLGPIQDLLEKYEQKLATTLSRYMLPSGEMDWAAILKMIND